MISLTIDPNGPIKIPLKIELSEYTILAGNNNAGKTTIMQGIKKKLEKDYIIAYVGASDSVDNQSSTTTKTSNFSKAIAPVISAIFDQTILKDTIKKFDSYGDKKNFENEINRILNDEYKVTDTSINLKLTADEFNEDVIRKLIQVKAKDILSKEDNIELKDIGHGVQRLLLSSFVRYYAELKKSSDVKKVIVIFEEPETHLNPKLKEKLYKALLDLSEKKDVASVVISTHDPHFIKLSTEKLIYHVSRSEIEGTQIELLTKEKTLIYDSPEEINYKVFNYSTEVFFLQLYESLKENIENNKSDTYKYSDFDTKIFYEEFKIEQDYKDAKNNNISYLTRLRHNFAHGKDSKVNSMLNEGIEKLIEIHNETT